MVNPGTWHGQRLKFLEEHREQYDAAAKVGNDKEEISSILRAWFRRFPAAKPDSWEPSEEELQAINDNQAEEEVSEPDTT
ncbi:hypothetical protein K435DRAFT_557738, partial [Dendrothele bispora CBS 962.96]